MGIICSVTKIVTKNAYTGVSVSGQSGYRDPPLCDSLKGQILSGQFDPRGLAIRTQKASDSLKGQLLSGQFDPRCLGIRTSVRIPRPRVENLIQRFQHVRNKWFIHVQYVHVHVC